MDLISSKDGASIACWHGGAGERLLLVHGTSGDRLAWTPVLPALERHFEVWAFDRRGRGQSGDADGYAFERECEDIAAIMDAIGGTVHLLGHSFGGLCALEAALLAPGIGKLILYEPPISLTDSGWSPALDAKFETLLEAGKQEEVLLLFFREIVKMPLMRLPPYRLVCIGLSELPRRIPFIANCAGSIAMSSRPSGFMALKLRFCSCLVAKARPAATILLKCFTGRSPPARSGSCRGNNMAR